MKPGLRDLVFTAIGRRERDRRTDIFSVGYFNDSANKTPVQMLEHHCCPTLSEITSVASEYGVSNVKATLVELNKVMASYEEKWNGGVSQT